MTTPVRDEATFVLRPRFGRKPKSDPGSARQAVVRGAKGGKRVVRLLAKVARGDKSSRQRSAAAERAGARAEKAAARIAQSKQRRVVLKARYVKLTGRGQKAAALHLRYIERDGVEADGSRGVLYSKDGLANRDSMLQPLLGEQHQFRFILSPEDGSRLDLTEYTRDFMAKVQQDLGPRRELIWAAVNHHDTDNPHVHIVVRGVDARGREVRFDRDYLSHGMRERAMELATNELGLATDAELQKRLHREVAQDRFTSLDRTLERTAEEGRVRLAALSAVPSRTQLIGRLQELERTGLAHQEAPGVWALAEGWQATLRDRGARADIVAQMNQAMRGRVPEQWSTYEPNAAVADAPPLRGVVRAKGLADELKDVAFAVIETPDGRAHYVRLTPRAVEQVRVGDAVALHARRLGRNGAPDAELERIAARQDGLISPSHLRADAAKLGPGGAEAAGRRLDQLARAGIVERLPDGWRVSPGLAARAERQESTSPRYAVTVDRAPLHPRAQVDHRGPVWLDALEGQPLARFGLGAELRALVARRDEQVRNMGIDPASRSRVRELAELERRELEEALQRTRGLKPHAAGELRGRVQALPPAPSGREYVAVATDDALAVLPMSKQLRARLNQELTPDLRSPDRARRGKSDRER